MFHHESSCRQRSCLEMAADTSRKTSVLFLKSLQICRTGEVPRAVAVVQLASALRHRTVRCYLLHIAYSGITPGLSDILTSPVRHCTPR